MEKGRSPDPILNCQCRRACGLQLASGIRWRRRHLETTRNPTDRGSRLALSGALAPGETVSRSEGQRRSRFLSARAGAARSCGLTHAEFATAISAPVPKASLPVPSSLHSGTRFEPGSAAATADARLRDLASFATPVSELPPGAASTAPVRLPRRLRRQQHRWAAEPGPHRPRFFLELFAAVFVSRQRSHRTVCRGLSLSAFSMVSASTCRSQKCLTRSVTSCVVGSFSPSTLAPPV